MYRKVNNVGMFEHNKFYRCKLTYNFHKSCPTYHYWQVRMRANFYAIHLAHLKRCLLIRSKTSPKLKKVSANQYRSLC